MDPKADVLRQIMGFANKSMLQRAQAKKVPQQVAANVAEGGSVAGAPRAPAATEPDADDLPAADQADLDAAYQALLDENDPDGFSRASAPVQMIGTN